MSISLLHDMKLSELISRMIDERDPRYAAEIDWRMNRYREEEQILDRTYGDLRSTGALSHRCTGSTIERTIDTRPCDPFLPEDCDWGEQDSLDNVPRKVPP